ncbi:MAG: SDR family NAD(P)-dependent oxidoreductase [Nitrososphaeraceae archaeon]
MNPNESVAIVTGAGGGVGRAISKRLFSEGAKIVMVGRDLSRLTTLARECGDENSVLPIRGDITKESDVVNIIEQTISVFDRVDILINSAGTINEPKPFHLMSEDEWAPLIETNLIGTFRTTKAVLPIMMESKRGNIVNISSLLGMRAIPRVPLSVYGVTKAAVIMFTKSIAVEYGQHGIRCNCIAPSTIRTQSIEPYLEDEEARMTLESSFPLRRIGNAEDIAGSVAYLCSNDANWITGIVITVDGGISAKQ